MKKIITSEKQPIKLWLDDIDAGAMEQARNLANLPFVHKHIAVMPDAHLGYGMPIGGVMATKDMIIPNAVGVDIGCGMCAVQTSLQHISREKLKHIMGLVRSTVPLGFKHHKKKQNKSLMPKTPGGIPLSDMPIVSQEFHNALTQLGTLGGGNHFIEIQKGSDDYIWIMVHSGSRNIGFKVANYYNRLAIQLNSKWGSSIPKNWQLAFLPMDSEAGRNYFNEMKYCVDFALANRNVMMERIKDAFLAVTPPVFFNPSSILPIIMLPWKPIIIKRFLFTEKGQPALWMEKWASFLVPRALQAILLKAKGMKKVFHPVPMVLEEQWGENRLRKSSIYIMNRKDLMIRV